MEDSWGAMLAIDPRLEFLSRRIGKLDKRVLRCVEMKIGKSVAARAEIDAEIKLLREEREWMVKQVGQIPQYEAGAGILQRIQAWAPGGDANTSAAYRVIE